MNTTPLPIEPRERPAKVLSRDEDEFQFAVVELLRLYAADDIIWEAVNSGGFKLGMAAAKRQKKLGIRKGSPDIHFVLRDGRAAKLELKSGTGTQTQEQRDYELQCIRLGVPYALVHTMDQVIEVFKAWRVLKRGVAI